jgi:hypothetical protein
MPGSIPPGVGSLGEHFILRRYGFCRIIFISIEFKLNNTLYMSSFLQKHSIQIANTCSEDVTNFKYLGTTLTD